MPVRIEGGQGGQAGFGINQIPGAFYGVNSCWVGIAVRKMKLGHHYVQHQWRSLDEIWPVLKTKRSQFFTVTLTLSEFTWPTFEFERILRNHTLWIVQITKSIMWTAYVCTALHLIMCKCWRKTNVPRLKFRFITKHFTSTLWGRSAWRTGNIHCH